MEELKDVSPTSVVLCRVLGSICHPSELVCPMNKSNLKITNLYLFPISGPFYIKLLPIRYMFNLIIIHQNNPTISSNITGSACYALCLFMYTASIVFHFYWSDDNNVFSILEEFGVWKEFPGWKEILILFGEKSRFGLTFRIPGVNWSE